MIGSVITTRTGIRTLAAGIVSLLASLTALAPASAISNDQDFTPQSTGSGGATYTCPAAPPGSGPRYTVKTLHFRAADESHWDAWGSDEPFWVFSAVGTDGTNRTTRTSDFGDVDSGDTRSFTHWIWGNSCWGETAPNGIGMSIQLWEHDNGDMASIRNKTKEYFDKAGCIAHVAAAPEWVQKAISYVGTGVDYAMGLYGDEFFGSNTYAYSASTLASRLPSVGSYFDDERWYGGSDDSGGADYYLRTRVKRVA